MIDFAGWLMPVQYASILEEHRAVRERAGLFDLSHMGELFVEGAGGAGEALAYALVTNPPALADGRAQYSMICAPDGGIIDDLIVYRLADDRFLVVANAGNAQVVSDALAERLAGFKAVLDDRSLATGARRDPGPALGRDPPAADRRRPRRPALLRDRRGHVAGIPALVARTGYTGEDGFEVFVDTGRRVELWDALLAGECATPAGVPVGLGARDTLRLEAGMPLYGNELDRDHEPVRGGPRPGRQARQGRRLRRSGGAREGRPRRRRAAGSSGSRRGPRHRPPRLSGPRRRRRERRRDQRDPVADPRRADRDGLRRPGRRRAGYDGRRRDPRRSGSPPGRRPAVLPPTADAACHAGGAP